MKVWKVKWRILPLNACFELIMVTISLLPLLFRRTHILLSLSVAPSSEYSSAHSRTVILAYGAMILCKAYQIQLIEGANTFLWKY